MRAILGVGRSVHFTIANLHGVTNMDKLSDRRQQSLHKFMLDVVEERIYFRMRSCCMKRIRTHATRSRGYIIPRFNTSLGQQRIAVRGLKLLNQFSNNVM
jgi:hypothetical protein